MGRKWVMAALHHQAVDPIPWVPLFDAAVMDGSENGVPENLMEALHLLGCDALARHGPKSLA
jgi:hypothetical protein